MGSYQQELLDWMWWPYMLQYMMLLVEQIEYLPYLRHVVRCRGVQPRQLHSTCNQREQ